MKIVKFNASPFIPRYVFQFKTDAGLWDLEVSCPYDEMGEGDVVREFTKLLSELAKTPVVIEEEDDA